MLAVDTIELGESSFAETPEALDAVDMVFPAGELVAGMVDPVVVVTVEDEAVVSLPAVGVDRAAFEDFPLYHGHQGFPGAVFDHFDMHFPAPFEKAEDGGLARGPAPSFSPDPPCSEIGFVQLDFA